MAESTEKGQVPAGFEHVHVELDWWDGTPRGGLADVNGSTHYFQAVAYHDPDEPDDEYFVWPASETAVALEREQWAIFAEWNMRYEAGSATVDTHPATPGTNTRYDELQILLEPHRAVPDHPRRLAANWHWGDRAERYPLSGPIYWVKWHGPNL